jgi:trigger factor
MVLYSENAPHFLENAGYIAQGITLKMTELGLAACWMTINDAAATKEALGEDTDMEVACVVAFGYRDEDNDEKKAPKIIPAEINQELFDKVFGEGTVKGEKEFREKVKADMKAQMDDDAKYRFGIDVKAAVMKKMEKVSFPEEFLKRWLKTANKELTDEQIEKEWEQTLNGLRWQLAKDQLAEQFQIKVEKADVDNLAKDFARMQFMQYGLTHIEDQYLEQFAADMLKDENQTRAIYERCLENKLYEALKGVVKLESKTISYEDFIKLH